MATHSLVFPQGRIKYRFVPLTPFELEIPQPDGKTATQPYKVGVAYNVREGNDWLDNQVSNPETGLVKQGKARIA